MKLKIGLPKGSLQNATVRIFEKAGFNIQIRERTYFPLIDDEEMEIILLRAQEIPRYVEEKVLDLGLTGKDWIMENNSKVIEVSDLIYAKEGLTAVKWVLAVPENSKVKKPTDLKGKKVATELVSVTKRYFKKIGIKVAVEFSWGATEVKSPKLCDGIVELTETGTSLKAHNLRIVDTVLESTTKLITNKEAWRNKWKRERIENLNLLLQGALLAEKKVGLKMNVSRESLKKIITLLPAIKKPTVSPLSEKGWFALETVIDEEVVRDIIPKLKRIGAIGIVEYPLNKVIY